MNAKLFIVILISIALLAVYHALFQLPVLVVLARFFALAAFFLLCVSLLIGPLGVFWDSFKPLIKQRRLIGIAGFAFIALHFLVVFHSQFRFDFFLILKETKYLIALAALVVFFAMAITSNNFTIRKISFPNWKLVQRLTYIGFALSLAHFYLDSNGLFIRAGEKVFLNLAEAILLLLVFRGKKWQVSKK